MNAAFLLLTSAWMAGADAAPAPAAAPATVAGSSCCGGCGTSCDTGCGRKLFTGALRARLSGLFHKDCCDSCAPACPPAPCCKPACPPAPCCKPAPVCCKPAPVCCTPAPVCKPAPVCCKPAPVCCTPAPVCKPACDPCADSCGRTKLIDRLRGLFHKDCCGGCDPCCGGTAAPAPAAEPKKMPATVGSIAHPASPF